MFNKNSLWCLITIVIILNFNKVIAKNALTISNNDEHINAGLMQNSIAYGVLSEVVMYKNLYFLNYECEQELKYMLNGINNGTMWAIKGNLFYCKPIYR